MRHERTVSDSLSWVDVAAESDLPPGAILCVRAHGRDLAVYRLVTGELRKSDNRCTHEEASLADGWLDGHVIECPLHGGRFDLDTGHGLCSPIERPLEVFAVKVRSGRIVVAIPQADDGAGTKP
jgi:naphthalene 1,2-dioxygenase system ferredoxin subunit